MTRPRTPCSSSARQVTDPIPPAPPVMMAFPPTAKRAFACSEGLMLLGVGLGGAVFDVADPSLNCIEGGIRDVSMDRSVDMLSEGLDTSSSSCTLDEFTAGRA